MEKYIKTIQIDKSTHDKLKKYCKKYNLKLNSWASALLESQINQLENIQNVPYSPEYKFKEK